MYRYLKLYQQYMKLNFSALMAYRGNFYNDVLATLGWAIFHIVTMLILTNNVQEVFGWKTYELLILTGVHSIVMGIYHFTVSPNLNRVPNIIHYGQLDLLLVKPVDTQFQLSFRIVNYSALSRVVAGSLFVAYMLFVYHVNVTWMYIASFILLSFVGLILFYAIWYIVLTVTVWHSDLTNLPDVLYELGGMTKFPKEMYQGLRDYILFFLLPIVIIVSVPTRVLLKQGNPQDVLLLFTLAVGLLLVSRVFWHFALRFYTSASS